MIATNSHNVVRLSEVTKVFRMGGTQVEALKGIDLAIKAGEYLSSHLLGDFRKCPLLYHRKRCGLLADEDRPAALQRTLH